jgi:hypothetical protein
VYVRDNDPFRAHNDTRTLKPDLGVTGSIVVSCQHLSNAGKNILNLT